MEDFESKFERIWTEMVINLNKAYSNCVAEESDFADEKKILKNMAEKVRKKSSPEKIVKNVAEKVRKNRHRIKIVKNFAEKVRKNSLPENILKNGAEKVRKNSSPEKMLQKNNMGKTATVYCSLIPDRKNAVGGKNWVKIEQEKAIKQEKIVQYRREHYPVSEQKRRVGHNWDFGIQEKMGKRGNQIFILGETNTVQIEQEKSIKLEEIVQFRRKYYPVSEQKRRVGHNWDFHIQENRGKRGNQIFIL